MTVRSFIREIYNHGNLSVLTDLVAEPFRFHGLEREGERITDLALHFAFLQVNWERVFREYHFDIQELRTEGDQVNVRLKKWGVYRHLPEHSRQEIRCEVYRTEIFLTDGQKIREWRCIENYPASPFIEKDPTI